MKLTYMRTVDLAHALNLSVQQVRSHEAWGFLPPVERSAHGYRLFTEHHLRALKTARALIAASYSWQIAADIMKAVHRGDMDTALVFVNARHAALHREQREIDTAAVSYTHLDVYKRQPLAWCRPLKN